MTRWHRLLALAVSAAQLCAASSVDDALANARSAIAVTAGSSSAGLTLTSLLAKIADNSELKNAVIEALGEASSDSEELSDPYGESPPVYPSREYLRSHEFTGPI